MSPDSPSSRDSPNSKRNSPFRPISRMLNKSKDKDKDKDSAVMEFLNKDPFADGGARANTSSSGGAVGERPLHVMTPAKGRSALGVPTPAPSGRATPSGLRRPSTGRPSIGGSAVGRGDDVDDQPIKIRAGMTPEARTRLMPQPRPIHKSQQQQYPSSSRPGSSLSQSNSDRPTSTMRLVQSQSGAGRDEDPFDSPVPVSALGRSVRGAEREMGGEVGRGMEELGDEMEGMGLEEWDKSRKGEESVLVTIRIRPISNPNDSNAWSTLMDAGSSRPRTMRLADGSRKDWVFDQILPPTISNAETYISSALPHVRSAMAGFNSVCFAYGQTGSGKSHTMAGTTDSPGVVPLAVEEIFRIIKREDGREWVLRASYLELYNEGLGDLLADGVGAGTTNEVVILNGKKEGEVRISGLTEMVVTNVGEVRKVLAIGEGRRRTGCTDWNERSSRSHSVFRIVIESRLKGMGEGDDTHGKNKATRISTLSLIDLAGSEKATDSKERNAEGKHINQSLLTLRNVISKLAEQGTSKKAAGHIPFRDSKLTRLLQPSLSGDAKISVICTINPSASAIAESQSTLAFASGIKRVVLNAKQTEVVDPAALIQQYQNEIAELKAKLAAKDAASMSASTKRMTVSEREEQDRSKTRLAELMRLILTSSNVDETATAEKTPTATQDGAIQYGQSSFTLQEDLYTAQAKIKDQQREIDQLKKELAVRPRDPSQRCVELQLQVDQLTEMTMEYEKNLLEPARKLREDVEKEFQPKIAALEARAAEKDQYNQMLFQSASALKAEKEQLKKRCDHLEDMYRQFLAELEQENGQTKQRSPSHHRRSVSSGDKPPVALRPVLDNPRLSSVSMATVQRKLAISNLDQHSKSTLRPLREDSMFDIAKQAAIAEQALDDDFF